MFNFESFYDTPLFLDFKNLFYVVNTGSDYHVQKIENAQFLTGACRNCFEKRFGVKKSVSLSWNMWNIFSNIHNWLIFFKTLSR